MQKASSLNTRENIRLENRSVAEGFSSVRSCVPAVVPRYKRERIKMEKKERMKEESGGKERETMIPYKKTN